MNKQWQEVYTVYNDLLLQMSLHLGSSGSSSNVDSSRSARMLTKNALYNIMRPQSSPIVPAASDYNSLSCTTI